ncbi:MAG: 5-carboxymethyl-2-hydroxymuconate Delta-isomerase [Pseudomonadota bacterium]
MPHIVIEASAPVLKAVAPDHLLKATYEGAVASELFDSWDIKSRLVPYTHHHQGKRTLPFIHVTAKILSGRTDEQKKRLSDLILEKLQAFGLKPVSLTVTTEDIRRETYAKEVLS